MKTVTPDWHYRWHEGRWWYWMPTGNWMVWTGSTWVPYAQWFRCPNQYATSQAIPYTTSYGSYDAQSPIGPAQPTYMGGGNYQPRYWGTGSYQPTYSTGAARDSAGYGWSWGPGTAFRDAPGRRF